MTAYRGRFAPSPSGPLHPGSLVAALASWLDARAHGGVWLLRIDDLDAPRTVPGAAAQIVDVLAACGLRSDAAPVRQSDRHPAYQRALDRLDAAGLLYPCGCTRREIADSFVQAQQPHQRHATLAYPGTCRAGLHGRPARAWRLRVPDDGAADGAALIRFVDRGCGPQAQNLATEVGDFVLKRADGQWAYQLAVVVDDGDAGVTHVVRGADLLDSTARQIYLQRCLGLPTPSYLHVPVVLDAHGDKLSKQTGAAPVDPARPLDALAAASAHLRLDVPAAAHASVDAFLAAATVAWTNRHLRS